MPSQYLRSYSGKPICDGVKEASDSLCNMLSEITKEKFTKISVNIDIVGKSDSE